MAENTTKGFGSIILVVGIGALVIAAYLFRPIPAAEKEIYGRACSEWIGKEFNDDRTARVSDVWRKRGHLVFEVLAAKENSTSASVFLCVVDPKTGNMRKPSAFDT